MVDNASTNSNKDGTTSYKLVMLGEAGVGKTCIVNKYTKNIYTT